MENEHGRVAETTWNKRPDGTVETKTLYEDGYSELTEGQDYPPKEGDVIHVETITRNDGSFETMSQTNDGKTETKVFDSDGNDISTGDNGGVDNGGADNGEGDNGGVDNGEGDNGGVDNGGVDNGGVDNGGVDNGGADNGGGGDNN